MRDPRTMRNIEETRVPARADDPLYRVARYLSVVGHPFIALPATIGAVSVLRGGQPRDAAAPSVWGSGSATNRKRSGRVSSPAQRSSCVGSSTAGRSLHWTRLFRSTPSVLGHVVAQRRPDHAPCGCSRGLVAHLPGSTHAGGCSSTGRSVSSRQRASCRSVTMAYCSQE